MQNMPDINIVCEKLAIAGATRFEDRFRLPLGTSINLTSYAAKLLVLAMYDSERGIQLVESFGKTTDMRIVDCAALCSTGAPAVSHKPCPLLGGRCGPLTCAHPLAHNHIG